MPCIIFMLTAVSLSLLFAACGNDGATGRTGRGGSERFSSAVTIAGSTSVQPLSQELADAFMDDNPGFRIDVQGGGSGQGVKAVREDLVDFGMLSRELKDDEKDFVTNEYIIAKDAIVIIVNKNVEADDLTLEQLKGIFAGDIKDWSEVGGTTGKIVVVSREAGSGTREAFCELTGLSEKDATGKSIDRTADSALIQGSTGAIMMTVSAAENSIGYVSLGALNENIKTLKVEGVEPSTDTVLNGSYMISRPFLYISGHEPDEAARTFLNYVVSQPGQDIVEKMGFVPAW